MIKNIIFFIALCFAQMSQAQTTAQSHQQSFGLQVGLTLLENPFVLYPMTNFSYSKTVLGQERHQVAVLSQLGIIFLPNVENKFLISPSVQYRFIGKKRFESNVYLGINYQLRHLAYNRYEYEDNVLVKKGKSRHQFGPIMGWNIGYKIIKRENYSITPVLGISLAKLNKNYPQPNLFTGYKPTISFGITVNKK
jgi:hypothetical protein